MMYDLKAMEFDYNTDSTLYMFNWNMTPDGEEYWCRAWRSLTLPQEAADKIQAMRDQYEREKRPAVGVLHDWDGGGVPPVPEGTEVTCWLFNEASKITSNGLGGWSVVKQYLVHSYPEPEPKRIAGTVAEYDNEPDFTTWVADDAV